MEKVILITSREFIKLVSEKDLGFKELESYSKDTVTNGDVELGTEETILKGYLGMFFKDPWGSQGFVDPYGDANEIKKTINGLGIKNWKTGQLFRFGIWWKDLENTRIYVADEFPFYTFGFSYDKQYYMNALLEELKKNVDNDNNSIKWEVYSHDLDWGVDALSKELNKDSVNGTVDAENTTLLDFLKNEDAKVFVFQHSKLSEKYMEIKNKFLT